MNAARLVKERTDNDLIDLLYRQTHTVLAAVVVVATTVAWLFYGEINSWIVLGWWGSNMVWSLYRLVQIHIFFRRRDAGKIDDYNAWGRIYTFNSLVSGCIWAVIPFTFVIPSEPVTVLVVYMVLTGMVAGAVASLALYLPAFLAYAIPAILSLMSLAYRYEDYTNSLIFLLTVYLVAVLVLAIRTNQASRMSIQRRFENLDLMEALQQQKEVAETAYMEKSRFLAAASHDLRQPLQALTMFHEALKWTDSNDAKDKLLSKATTATQSLSNMLNALLSLSQLEAGLLKAQPQRFNVESLFRSVIEESQAAAQSAGITLKVRVTKEAWVWSDPIIVERIIRNLVTNAIRHCPNSRVLLSAQQRDDQLRLCVWDNGPGFSPDKKGEIFQEYVQLNNPERDINKGLGLGLNIVKRLTQLILTDIDVDSRKGHGTRFCFTVPLADDSVILEVDEAEMITPDNEEGMSLDGLFVLIIEDDTNSRESLSSLLFNWSCEVLEAESAMEALELLKGENHPQPDLILTDYRLRDHQTGTQAIREIRKHYQYTIPAIVMTGDIKHDVAKEVEELVASLMIKPVKPAHLYREIQNRAYILGIN